MKLSEQHLLELKVELEELITEREGMVATNSQRIHLGRLMAYEDDAFQIITNHMKAIREQLIHLGEK